MRPTPKFFGIHLFWNRCRTLFTALELRRLIDVLKEKLRKKGLNFAAFGTDFLHCGMGSRDPEYTCKVFWGIIWYGSYLLIIIIHYIHSLNAPAHECIRKLILSFRVCIKNFSEFKHNYIFKNHNSFPHVISYIFSTYLHISSTHGFLIFLPKITLSKNPISPLWDKMKHFVLSL